MGDVPVLSCAQTWKRRRRLVVIEGMATQLRIATLGVVRGRAEGAKRKICSGASRMRGALFIYTQLVFVCCSDRYL